MLVEAEPLLRPYWPIPNHRVHVMVSGGADSMALLALVSEFARIIPREIIVHHCNHGVHPEARTWCEFVGLQSRRCGFGFQRHDLRLEINSNFEDSARKARYKAVLDYLESGDIVMTAHHLDDQIETILIRLSQGSGLMGLTGIPSVRNFGCARLVRPLLKLTHLQLKQLLVNRKIAFMNDPSNEDLKYLRNFTRKKLIPALTKVSPNAQKQILQLSKLATKRIIEQADKLGNRLPTTDVFAVKLAETEHLIEWQVRFFAQSRNVFAPSTKEIREFANQCLQSSTDRMPALRLSKTAIIRRWRGSLHWIDKPKRIEVSSSGVVRKIYLNPNSHITVNLYYGRLILKTTSKPANVCIWDCVSRQSFRLGRNRPMQSLKKIAQTLSVAPWLRRTTPLITESEIVIGWGAIDCREPHQKLDSLNWEWQFVPMQKEDISVS